MYQPKPLLTKPKLEFLITYLQKAKNIAGAAIEVGCYQGATLLEMAKWIGGTKTIIGYDTFEGLPDPTAIDLLTQNPHNKGDFADTDFKAMSAFFKEYGVQLIKGRFPFSASDRKISFAHLDVDLFDSTRTSLAYLEHNLSPGGLIVVDDYAWSRTPGVAAAVDEFIADHRMRVIDKSAHHQIVLGK